MRNFIKHINTKKFHQYSVAGNSLSEVLVALFISSVMLMVMGQTYVSIKNNYMWHEKKLFEMQDALLVVDWLKNEIHTAGLMGCNHQSALNIERGSALFMRQSLSLLKSSNLTLPKSIRQHAVKDSSVLLITKLAEPISPIKHSQKGSELVSLVKPSTLSAGQTIVLSDCQYAVKSEVKSISHSKMKLTLTTALTRQYGSSAVIGALNTSIIYIRQLGENKRALYVSDGKRSEELVRNITELKASKTVQAGKSLIYIQLKRLDAQPLSFYSVMYGE